MMADNYDYERLRGGGHGGIMADGQIWLDSTRLRGFVLFGDRQSDRHLRL